MLFSFVKAYPQDQKIKPFKCPAGIWEDERTSDPGFNELLDKSCSEINKENYTTGLQYLVEAINRDSTSTGIANEYLVAQRSKLQVHIEKLKENQQATGAVAVPAAGSASATEEIKKEEAQPEAGGNQPDDKTASSKGGVKDQESTSQNNSKPDQGSLTETKPSETTPVVMVAATGNPENSNSNSAAGSVAEKKAEPVKDNKAESEDIFAETSTTRTDINSISVNLDEDSKKIDKGAFTKEELGDFQIKGMQKIEALEGYIQDIANKNKDQSVVDIATENAVQLFDSEDRTVEVSAVSNEEKVRHKVRKYFQRLRMLPYDNVTIEWAELRYTSDFILGTDGNYYGYVVFRQLFTSTLDNVSAYEDLTTKKTLVILKKYTKYVEGKAEQNWDVFLGDISVQQTERN